MAKRRKAAGSETLVTLASFITGGIKVFSQLTALALNPILLVIAHRRWRRTHYVAGQRSTPTRSPRLHS